MTDSERATLKQRLELRCKGEKALGRREWSLLSCYGKLMDGPYAGAYVSGIPHDEQLALVQRLANGQTVPVHLMHKHRSGNYEASELRLSPNGLVMVFGSKEEPA